MLCKGRKKLCNKIFMETKNNCGCDLSKISLDMTVRECLEKLGFDPKAAQKKLKDCCENCCAK